MNTLTDEQKEVVKQIMDHYDTDKNGWIDNAELHNVLMEMKKFLKDNFEADVPDDEIKRIVNETDVNQDGKINIEEFVDSEFFIVFEVFN
jgi:Ca2+-binding EF-hand superfamily protein